ncbi:uncharacterized protein DC041_0002093 [Schistosoma bovis]|uniref:G-protein coupled receptors family 1 profile domain-containing protein n=1 Tax=Schistosoma bovis TaxID=6184 RepID=A0A430QSD2_SCHBO|nr:uncharacterized protein DC041_0002093 [Schistosoma bovis]
MNTTTLQFSFTFYYYVKYLGLCHHINDSNMFGKPMILPQIKHQIPFICFSFIGFILNFISLFVFLFGGDLIIRSRIHQSKQHEKILLDNEYSNISKCTIIQSTRSRHRKRTQSSFMISLIFLCGCEVIFNLGAFIFKLIQVLSSYFIHQIPMDKSNHIPPDMTLIILPVIQNILMFIAEVGLFSRNWCVCLITAARAEVVIWPIGSRPWQRILRNPRKFIQLFILLLFISIIIAGLKHTDYISLLCYDPINHQYGMWSQEYMFTHKSFSLYMSFIVLPYRAVITWILIILFTIMIIIRLRPWRKESSLLQISQSKSLDDIPMTNENPQHDAIRKRQKGQMKATRVVLMVALAFGLLECMNFMISLCQTFNLLDNNHLSRLLETIGNTLITIDSICNFFVFISLMSYFRIIFLQIFCCKTFNNQQNIPTNSTSYTSVNHSITGS